MHRPSTTVILDTRKPLKSKPGKYSVKLRVGYHIGGNNYKHIYYPLKIYLGKKEFDQIRKSPKDNQQKDIRDAINATEAKAWRIAGRVADRRSFEAQYFSVGNTNNLKGYFDRAIDQMVKAGRTGTAGTYKVAWSSFQKFKSEYLLVSDITSEWLHAYEKWMTERGRSISTIGMNLRALRSLMNQLISTGEMDAELYPFSSYSIKTEMKIKIPVVKEDIDKLKAFEGNEREMKAVAFWLFSYYCNGMNMNDILSLLWTDINGDYIIYDRNKTKTTKKKVKKVLIPIKNVAGIIERYGDRDSKFVFPVLEGLTGIKRKYALGSFLKFVNLELENVRERLGIKTRITHAIARHSFANQILNSGMGKDFIQYAMAHTDSKTTEHYLSGFKIDTINKGGEFL